MSMYRRKSGHSALCECENKVSSLAAVFAAFGVQDSSKLAHRIRYVRMNVKRGLDGFSGFLIPCSSAYSNFAMAQAYHKFTQVARFCIYKVEGKRI